VSGLELPMLDSALAAVACLGAAVGLGASMLGRLVGDWVGDALSRTGWGRALDERIAARLAKFREGGAA
jgi:hypothetical protein